MTKRDQETCECEDPCACQKHSPCTEKASQVYGERPDEHHRSVERGVDPRPLVDAEMQLTSNVGQTHAHQATSACRNECAEQHSGDSQQGVGCYRRASILRVGVRICHWSSVRPPALPV